MTQRQQSFAPSVGECSRGFAGVAFASQLFVGLERPRRAVTPSRLQVPLAHVFAGPASGHVERRLLRGLQPCTATRASRSYRAETAQARQACFQPACVHSATTSYGDILNRFVASRPEHDIVSFSRSGEGEGAHSGIFLSLSGVSGADRLQHGQARNHLIPCAGCRKASLPALRALRQSEQS